MVWRQVSFLWHFYGEYIELWGQAGEGPLCEALAWPTVVPQQGLTLQELHHCDLLMLADQAQQTPGCCRAC